MGIFDNAIAAVAKTTGKLFGYPATWGEYSATVFYKDMPGQQKLGDIKFGVDKWLMEYVDTDFPGLKDLINKNNKPIVSITVRGVATQFYCKTADALSDGLYTQVKMQLKP